MDRFLRSWELFKSSLTVMRQNKTLLAFPVLIFLITTFVVLLFMTPIAFQPTGYSYLSAEHWTKVGQSLGDFKTFQSGATHPGQLGSSFRHHGSYAVASKISPLAVAYFALTYFISMFLATFLNVAFYSQILNALSGRPVSIAAGLQFALTKWKIILMWTLFAGLVGFLIKMIEERFGFVGGWIMRLLGTVWSVACVFVIPVIITESETTNPIIVLKKSAQTLTKTWGESLIGYVGVSMGGAAFLALSLFWLGGGIVLAIVLNSLWLGAVTVLSWLAAIIVFGYLVSVASQIFRCALFLYASQGTLPQPYTPDMMNLAWKIKKS